MLTTKLIDFDNVVSGVESRSSWNELDLETQAHKYAVLGGHLAPMTVKRIDHETYAVIGDKLQNSQKFWVAVKASEMNLLDDGGMMHAYIVEDKQAIACIEEEAQKQVQPTDDEILDAIIQLDEENGTDNYLPIFHYRAKFPNLSRKEQDLALYRLEASDKIELSALQETRAYTVAQVEEGIPQDIGGRLFFIIVEKPTEKPTKLDKPQKQTRNPELVQLSNAIALDNYRDIQKALRPFKKKQKAIRLNAPKQQLTNWATKILMAAA